MKIKNKKIDLDYKVNNKCISKRLFAVSFGLLTCLGASAQIGTVSVNIKNGSIEQLFDSVEKQSNYSFSYRKADVKDIKNVNVTATNTGLRDLLLQQLSKYNLAFTVSDNKIVVVPSKKIKVTGQVFDVNQEPVIGATVMVKGTTNGTVTDLDGKFELLNVNKGDLIQVSFVGYVTREMRCDEQPMNVVLKEDAKALEEVVVVGYGSTTKRDMIASVSTVKAEQISNIPATNIAQGLAGRSPGLIVTANGGGINSTPNISIRGGGEPLYVIDGIIRSKEDFANLSPDDIDAMSILKDASATAVYGSRATNGIIQVTTKKGKEGKATIEYDFNASFAQPSVWPEKMDSWDRAYYSNVGRQNDGLEPIYSDQAIQAMRDGSDPLNYNNTDWRKLTLRNWAPQMKHTIRVTGGTENNQYYMSLGRIDQNSLYKSDTHWMKRTNFRLANSAFIEPIGLHINAALDGYVHIQNHPYTSSAGGYYQVFSHINDQSPLKPGINKYGLPYMIQDNPVAETAEDAGFIKNKNNVINGKGELVWDCLWLDGLKVRAASNYRYYSQTVKSWRKDAAKYEWDSQLPQYDNKPLLKHDSNTGYSFTNQIFLDYSGKFGDHSVSALAGFEQYYEKTEGYWSQRENYAFNIPQMSVGDANSQTNDGWEAELGRAAWIGQLKYNYKNKYYVEGSMRYDGSDRFAPGDRWGAFFSGSLGWVVTEEKFMQNLVDKNILNSLKLRASYGETGLDSDAGRFQYMTSYNLDPYALVVNGKYVPGFTEGNLPSPDLTWYTTKQFDLGFDFASLNNRLYGSFDYFYYSTKGYLMAPKGDSYVNTALGIGMPKIKSDSELRREGVELQLGWRDQIGAFKYDVATNFTFYNQLWALDENEGESARMNPFQRGQQRILSTSGLRLENLGYYQSADQVYNSVGDPGAFNTGYVTAGDIQYRDVNGDGQITGADMRFLGKSGAPRGQFGVNINLSYKGFYLSTLFQGSTAFDVYIPGSLGMQTGQAGTLPVMFDHQTDFWTPDNRDAQYPRLMSNTNLNGNYNYMNSDYWLVNGAYLRMKDFQFGYDFKYKLLKNVNWLTRAKVGISGQNIFTISKLTKYGIDPESNAQNYGYPVERTIAFTLNLGF